PSVGATRACVVTRGGPVVCFDPTSSKRPLALEKISAVDDAVDVAVGGSVACARRVSGQVSCWRPGDTDPVISVATTHTESIAASGDTACSLHADGIECFRRGFLGTLEKASPVAGF